MIASSGNVSNSAFVNQSVSRHGREPLRFTGRQLARSLTAENQPPSQPYGLELLVYETSQSDFVAGIILVTSDPNEKSVSTFERLDDALSVENFFFAFEPCEYLNKTGSVGQERERDKLAAELYTQYEIAMRDIISRFQSTQTEELRESHQPTAPKGSSS